MGDVRPPAPSRRRQRCWHRAALGPPTCGAIGGPAVRAARLQREQWGGRVDVMGILCALPTVWVCLWVCLWVGVWVGPGMGVGVGDG